MRTWRSPAPMLPWEPRTQQYRIEAQVYDTHTGQSTASATESTASSTNDPSARNVSSLQQAKALTLKADSSPNSPLKESLYRQALGRPQAGLGRVGNRSPHWPGAYETSLTYNGAENAATAKVAVHWARVRTRIGQVKEAVDQVNQAVPAARRQLPPDSLRFWNVLHDAIHTCNGAKDYRAAEGYTNEGLALDARMHLPATSEKWGMLYWDLGRAMQGEKNYREALAAFEKAEANLRQFHDTRTAEVEADMDAGEGSTAGGEISHE